MGNVGLDIGTNLLVAGMMEGDSLVFKTQRDAFYRIEPKTEVNKNSIKFSLDKRGANYIAEDNNFVVVGEDALEIAIERNDVAKRPMKCGVISPKEKGSLPILKLLIETMIGKGDKGDTCFFSVPAVPIDASFDILYHTEMMRLYIGQMGYNAYPINEAYCIGLSELIDVGLTGINLSFGAGMVNCAVLHEGESLLDMSIARSGDFIDQSVANALDVSPSLVQLEKEAGVDLYKPSTKIMEAVSVYYSSVITYAIQNIVYELNKNKKTLPIFKEPAQIIIGGGLSQAKGFVDRFNECLKLVEFPINVGEARLAKDPYTCVANGCFLAAQM